jgi:hypothetical protein
VRSMFPFFGCRKCIISWDRKQKSCTLTEVTYLLTVLCKECTKWTIIGDWMSVHPSSLLIKFGIEDLLKRFRVIVNLDPYQLNMTSIFHGVWIFSKESYRKNVGIYRESF